MNNGNKPYFFSAFDGGSRRQCIAVLVAALLLSPGWMGEAGLAFASAQPTPPVAQPAPPAGVGIQPVNIQPETAPTPSSVPASGDTALPSPATSAAEADPTATDSTSDELKNISTDEVLNMLKSGNTGEPLNVRQLAAINNLIKRMEYISQVEHKMSEMTHSLGSGVATSSALPMAQPMARSQQEAALAANNDARTYSISRVSGSGGKFIAVLSNGSNQLQVKQGDTTPIGRIAVVSLDGVTVETVTGSVQLAFSAPMSLSGVSATFGGR